MIHLCVFSFALRKIFKSTNPSYSYTQSQYLIVPYSFHSFIHSLFRISTLVVSVYNHMVRQIFQFLIGILFTFIPAVSPKLCTHIFLFFQHLRVCVCVCMYVGYFGEKIQAFMVLNKTIFSWLNKAFLFHVNSVCSIV